MRNLPKRKKKKAPIVASVSFPSPGVTVRGVATSLLHVSKHGDPRTPRVCHRTLSYDPVVRPPSVVALIISFLCARLRMRRQLQKPGREPVSFPPMWRPCSSPLPGGATGRPISGRLSASTPSSGYDAGRVRRPPSLPARQPKERVVIGCLVTADADKPDMPQKATPAARISSASGSGSSRARAFDGE